MSTWSLRCRDGAFDVDMEPSISTWSFRSRLRAFDLDFSNSATLVFTAKLPVPDKKTLNGGEFDVLASLSNLSNEKKGLDARLKTATQELFGQPRTDAKEVTQLLRKGFKEELAPVPRATAFDLLDQISKKVPSPAFIGLSSQVRCGAEASAPDGSNGTSAGRLAEAATLNAQPTRKLTLNFWKRMPRAIAITPTTTAVILPARTFA